MDINEYELALNIVGYFLVFCILLSPWVNTATTSKLALLLLATALIVFLLIGAIARDAMSFKVPTAELKPYFFATWHAFYLWFGITLLISLLEKHELKKSKIKRVG